MYETDLLDESRPYAEWVGGRRSLKVSPNSTHAMLALRIGGLLARLAGSRGRVGVEWRCRLPEADGPTSLVPDVACYAAERLARLPASDFDLPTIAPDVAVEIRSPSFDAAKLAHKVRLYLRHGTLLVLDLDPRARRVTAYAADGASAYDAAFAHPAAPWLRFSVPDLFAAL